MKKKNQQTNLASTVIPKRRRKDRFSLIIFFFQYFRFSICLAKWYNRFLPGLIPDSAVELFRGVYRLGVHLNFAHVRSCYLQRRLLHSTDHKSGEALQLCPISYILSIEIIKAWHPDKRYKEKLKKKKCLVWWVMKRNTLFNRLVNGISFMCNELNEVLNPPQLPGPELRSCCLRDKGALRVLSMCEYKKMFAVCANPLSGVLY